VIRFWAVRELGHAFRTTVEVHDGQDVVDTGPYRLVRHPSYTGLLLIAAGFGLGGGNWPGLALCVVLPALATLRRIRVEENEMIEVLGEPYRDYVTRTKRLFPGVW
jgi:protein-S-isoprenylcysteine O-methyltransferase Ste14